jgi:hypothetical protein
MGKILNLTQHPASAEQLSAGVIDPSAKAKGRIGELLTFVSLPDAQEIARRATALSAVALDHGVESAMIGGLLT